MTVLQPPRKFWLPKAGNRSDEYEDACRVAYPDRIGDSREQIARAAVADGASESAFAREWAKILTDGFVARHLDLASLDEDALLEWLKPAQDEWHECVPWDRIPWHGETKARSGAFATLLGLSIGAASDDCERLTWQAIAVGDCCLFVIHEDRLQQSFPLETADEFDNYPSLVSSNRSASKGLWDAVRSTSGECVSGDILILASDAIACWFLARLEDGEEPMETLMELEEANWADWVDEQREAGVMRNDDMTLLIVEVG